MNMKLENSLYIKSALMRIAFFLLLISGTSNLFAQISGDKASYTTTTNYSATALQDAIFVFCDNIGTGVGELKAVSPDGTSGWTFTWTKWSSIDSDFSISVTVENNQSESILTNLSDGLYKVTISKSGESDTEDQAWVLNNTNAQPTFNLTLLDCAGVHFSYSFTKKALQYADIPGGGNLDVPVEDKVKFTFYRSSSEINSLPLVNYDGSDKSFVDEDAFETEESYVMVVTDQYGCDFTSDPISTNTYAVKAEFTVNPLKGEAPLVVQFNDASKNATDYEWYLYKDFDKLPESVPLPDSLLPGELITDASFSEYEYLHPGEYKVKLIVKSDKGPDVCDDYFIIKTPIQVDTSLVDVANFFTPNGDGKNDVWMVKSQSLKSFHAIIFNRWGRVVHEWRNPEEGWNGKVNGKMANPGTYFYVIKAVGREEKKKAYTKKGSFMLIRK